MSVGRSFCHNTGREVALTTLILVLFYFHFLVSEYKKKSLLSHYETKRWRRRRRRMVEEREGERERERERQRNKMGMRGM